MSTANKILDRGELEALCSEVRKEFDAEHGDGMHDLCMKAWAYKLSTGYFESEFARIEVTRPPGIRNLTV
jgi:hypothetical protein